MKNCLFSIFVIVPTYILSQNSVESHADSVCETIKFIECKLDTIYTDEFTVIEIEIEDDCLVFDVSYGGGCGFTNFELITDGHWILTGLPKIFFTLKFTDQDLCKAIRYEKISFDLTPFKYEAKEGGIKLLINNTERSLLYKVIP